MYELNNLISIQYFAQYVAPYIDRAMWLCFSSPLHSWSKGSVTLQSADPYDSPVIDPNYFDDPRDLRDMVEGKMNLKLNIIQYL